MSLLSTAFLRLHESALYQISENEKQIINLVDALTRVSRKRVTDSAVLKHRLLSESLGYLGYVQTATVQTELVRIHGVFKVVCTARLSATTAVSVRVSSLTVNLSCYTHTVVTNLKKQKVLS